MNAAPIRFAFEIADELMLNIIEQGYAELPITLEMQFAHRLDEQRLAQALGLLFRARPILACRLARRWWKPFWEHTVVRGEAQLAVVSDEESYNGYKTSRFDTMAEAQLGACLLRAPAGDRLLLRVAHTICDAGGLKEISGDLAVLYNRLAENPALEPPPLHRGSRTGWQVLPYLYWKRFPAAVWRFLGDVRRGFFPLATHNLALIEGPRTPLSFQVRHFARAQVGALARYARKRQATLNDLMVAAFYRALATETPWDGRSGLRVQTTIDFRRWYMPDERAAEYCNLSSFEYPYLVRRLGADLPATLALVNVLTRRGKLIGPGLTPFFFVPVTRLLPHALSRRFQTWLLRFLLRLGAFPPIFTNMGPIEQASANFGRPAEAAWLLVPAIYPPVLGVGLSGYAGGLTISAGAVPSTAPVVESFYDRIVAELSAADPNPAH
jgi:NRPS condensation-like uncharacterized protein